MALEVLNYPLSPCGEKVRFALAEKGLPFKDHHIDLGSKENLGADFLRLNPKGLVPVLLDDEIVVSDSTVILEYIEDRWPDRPLRPDAPLERARMRRWTKHVDEVLHPAWPGIAWPILVRPKWLAKTPLEVEAMLAALLDDRRRERQRRLFELGLDSPEFQSSLSTFLETCEQMEAELTRFPWLAGGSYSLADIALLPYFVAMEVFGLERTFSGFEKVRAWYGLACGRRCFGGHPRNMLPASRLEEIRGLKLAPLLAGTRQEHASSMTGT
jgi:glutathione S-transferase